MVFGLFLVLYFFEPTHYGFYPQCLLHKWTGLSCPGCGGLRATHQLLHGHLAEAFRFNPLLILLLPLFAWTGLRHLLRYYGGKVFPSPFENAVVGWTLAVIVILFGIARNLPFGIFSWMHS